MPRPPRGSRQATWQRPPGRGARGERPRGPTHIRSGTSRRPSTIMSGRKSSLKAEVMFAAHPALGGRTGGGGARVRAAAGGETGRDRCARPPRGGRPSRHLSHSLPSRAPPIPSEIQRRGHGLRSARCGERGRSSAPARRRLTPEGPPGGGTCPRQAAAAAELAPFKNSPTFPRVPEHLETLTALSLPCFIQFPISGRLARGPRIAASFHATVWPKPSSLPCQNRTPKAPRGRVPLCCFKGSGCDMLACV